MPRALDLRAEIGRRDTYGTAIGQALARTTAAQSTLARLGEIASNSAIRVAMQLDPNDPASLTFAATQARNAMVEVGQLLNTQTGEEYLFGGSDFGNPPVPDRRGCRPAAWRRRSPPPSAPSAGAMRRRSLPRPGPSRSTTAPGVTPFSDFLVDPATGLAASRAAACRRPMAASTEIGLFANRNAAATSTGETTGSWARDLLRGLASIAALAPAAAASPTDFQRARRHHPRRAAKRGQRPGR